VDILNTLLMVKIIIYENMGYLVILWDYAGVVTDINIYDNYSTVPHTGEKIYYIKDYLLLLKDLKKLVQKPEI